MNVDGRPLLVLGDTGEGQSCVLGEAGLYEAGGCGEAPAYVDDEPVPEFGGVRVPEDMSRGVVAVRAQGLADDRGGRIVDDAAAEGTSVFAGGAVTTGPTAFPGAVDGAE